MKCPRCGSENLSVLESRADNAAIRRRRECDDCSARYTTYERIELSMPLVVKKDGARQPYDRAKLKAGMVRSCEKRPVSVEMIDQSVESIERKLTENFPREVPSRELGELVMEALRKLDKIAYVRFASVYREFSDISQFVETLEGLKEKRPASTHRSKKIRAGAGSASKLPSKPALLKSAVAKSTHVTGAVSRAARSIDAKPAAVRTGRTKS